MSTSSRPLSNFRGDEAISERAGPGLPEQYAPTTASRREARGLDESKARKFHHEVNMAASAYRATPWPERKLIKAERYWDGNVWTDHATPLLPQ